MWSELLYRTMTILNIAMYKPGNEVGEVPGIRVMILFLPPVQFILNPPLFSVRVNCFTEVLANFLDGKKGEPNGDPPYTYLHTLVPSCEVITCFFLFLMLFLLGWGRSSRWR